MITQGMFGYRDFDYDNWKASQPEFREECDTCLVNPTYRSNLMSSMIVKVSRLSVYDHAKNAAVYRAMKRLQGIRDTFKSINHIS